MPGNLEAPLILPEHPYDVNKKSARNPYPTTIFAPSNPPPPSRSQGRPKAGAANP